MNKLKVGAGIGAGLVASAAVWWGALDASPGLSVDVDHVPSLELVEFVYNPDARTIRMRTSQGLFGCKFDLIHDDDFEGLP